MNILKNSEIIDSLEYRKIYKNFNFESIYRQIFSGVSSYRFFNIEMIGDKHIKFTPKDDLQQMQSVSMLSKFFSTKENALFVMGLKPKVFHISHSKKILTYLHLDWLLVLKHLKYSKNLEQELIDYLQFETGYSDVKEKIESVNSERLSRSNIFTVNKNSSIVNLIDSSLNQNVERLSDKCMELIMKNNLISMIEISSGFDNSKLEQFLIELLKTSDTLSKKVVITQEMKFQMKIRKIKRTYKKGMYIVAQNSVIVDPRHTDSIYHEIGHWYHTYFHQEITKEKECELFAEEFRKGCLI